MLGGGFMLLSAGVMRVPVRVQRAGAGAQPRRERPRVDPARCSTG